MCFIVSVWGRIAPARQRFSTQVCGDYLQAELIKQGSKTPPGLGVALPPSTPPEALGVTLERSKQLCLQMYEKELLTDSSVQAMTAGTPEQQAAFAGETLFPMGGGGGGGITRVPCMQIACSGIL